MGTMGWQSLAFLATTYMIHKECLNEYKEVSLCSWDDLKCPVCRKSESDLARMAVGLVPINIESSPSLMRPPLPASESEGYSADLSFSEPEQSDDDGLSYRDADEALAQSVSDAEALEVEAPPEVEAPAEVEVEAPADVEVEAPAEVEVEAPAEVEVAAPAEVEVEAPAEVEVAAPAGAGPYQRRLRKKPLRRTSNHIMQALQLGAAQPRADDSSADEAPLSALAPAAPANAPADVEVAAPADVEVAAPAEVERRAVKGAAKAGARKGASKGAAKGAAKAGARKGASKTRWTQLMSQQRTSTHDTSHNTLQQFPWSTGMIARVCATSATTSARVQSHPNNANK